MAGLPPGYPDSARVRVCGRMAVGNAGAGRAGVPFGVETIRLAARISLFGPVRSATIRRRRGIRPGAERSG